MHLRRAILLFALVLGLTALAAAVSPTPKDNAPPVAPAPAASAAGVLPREVSFQAADSGRPQLRRAIEPASICS